MKKYSARLMSDTNVQQQMNNIVAQQFSAVSQTGNPEDEWQQFKAAMQVAGNDLLLEPTVAQKSFLSAATLDLIEQKKVAYLRLLDWRRSGGKEQRPQQSHRCSLEWSRKKEQGQKNPSKEQGHKNPQQIYREILNATWQEICQRRP